MRPSSRNLAPPAGMRAPRSLTLLSALIAAAPAAAAPARRPPGLHVLFWMNSHVQNVALLMNLYACANDIEVTYVLSTSEAVQGCWSVVEGQPFRSCVFGRSPVLTHVILADFLRGHEGAQDLLWSHSDMILNIDRVFGRVGRQHLLSAAGGLSSAAPLCFPVHSEALAADRSWGSPAWYVSPSAKHPWGNYPWNSSDTNVKGPNLRRWPSGLDRQADDKVVCSNAASLVNITHCCYGWADLAYVPRQMQADFVPLALALSNLSAESAVATIFNHLAVARGQEQGVEGAWKLLSCAGSCCRTLPLHDAWLTGAEPCGHRINLQRLRALNISAAEGPSCTARVPLRITLQD